MTIQQFIEKAVEGGYSALMGGDKMRSNEAILLDPLAWKAVGKVEGWSNDFGSSPENKHEWLYNMRRMIDALAEGKTIEQYLETL